MSVTQASKLSATICYLLAVRWRYAGYRTSISPAPIWTSTDLLFKSLEHLTSHYTIHDLKTPTSQKTGLSRVKNHSHERCDESTAWAGRDARDAYTPSYTTQLHHALLVVNWS